MSKIVTTAIVSILLLFSANLNAQSGRQLKRANDWYKMARYSYAIPEFENYLQTSKKPNLSTKIKLAYCYRMLNQMGKAEKLYSEIVQNPKTRPKIYFYYGETLMANGKYDDAKSWFSKYVEQKPDDEYGKKMLESCDKVKLIRPTFGSIRVDYLPMNTEYDDFSPMFYGNELVFVSDYSDRKIEFKSDFTGRSFLKLYISPPTVDNSFTEFEEFSKKINIINKNTGPSAFSSDGRKIYFTRNSDELSRNNQYNLQIFESSLINGKWQKGSVMSFCEPNHSYMHPSISVTGDTIYFVADKPKGQGGTDIYMAHKTANGGWSKAINLGASVNTGGNEGFPFIHQDGTLYFSSKGHSGFGGFDVFSATMNAAGVFTNVRNVGQPINSTKDDTGFILGKNKKEGFFASSRNEDDDDVFRFQTMDITLKGEVYDHDSNLPIDQATIVIKNEKGEWSTSSDKNGLFSIGIDYKQDYVVEVQKDGYTVFKQRITSKSITKSTDIRVTAILESNGQSYHVQPAMQSSQFSSMEEIQAPVGLTFVTEVYDQSSQRNLSKDVQYVLENRKTGKQELLRPNKKGEVVYELESDNVYYFKVFNKGYFPYSEVLKTDGLGMISEDTISRVVELERIQLNKAMIMENIYYASNEYEITPLIANELNSLVVLLEEHPALKIEITAHTDSNGSDEENLMLSDLRAKAVAAYVVNKGIASERVRSKGYGETQLLNRCANDVPCSDEEHYANRRTEFRLVAN